MDVRKIESPNLFKTSISLATIIAAVGQHGKIYIKKEARPDDLYVKVFVLDCVEEIKGDIDNYTNKVLVASGQLGGLHNFTVALVWYHEGKWKEDFYKITTQLEKEIELGIDRAEKEKKQKEDKILKNYE